MVKLRYMERVKVKDMTDYELVEIFKYHPPTKEQGEKYEDLRKRGLEFARIIVKLCPESRERSLAITKLQEVIMFSNASIAIHD